MRPAFLLGLLLCSPALGADKTAKLPRDPATGILLGAEPFRFEGKSGAAVLLIHGYSSTPLEMKELGRRLADAGHTVSGIRLDGHGTAPRDLRGKRWRQWYSQVEAEFEALKARHSRVYAVGFSLGGVLALRLAQERELGGVAALAPALSLTYKWYYLLPPSAWLHSAGYLIPFVVRTDRWTPLNDRSKLPEHLAYTRIPLPPVRSLHRLARSVRANAGRLDEPLLILHAPGDDVASPRAARRFFKRAASADKEFVALPRSNHLLTLDYDKEEVFARVRDFIGRLEANP